MELFQSLICWHGFDSRKRFTVISLVTCFTFILASVVFSHTLSFALLILVLLLITHVFSTQRRLNDAGLKKSWLIPPAIAFFITGFIILMTSSGVFYWLLLVPLVISSVLLTYPSNKKRDYVLGYYGPIDLQKYQTATPKNSARIEPSLYTTSHQVESTATTESSREFIDNSSPLPLDEKQDLGELIRLSLLSHQNALISLAGVASVIIVAIIISLIISNKESGHESSPSIEVEVVKAPIREKTSPITLPDNFTLMLSEFDGLIIHWAGSEESINEKLWSQFSALGENNCQQITFNKGNNIRTLEVNMENNQNYYAYFSPLDTREMVRAIAYQSTFSLCGYEFSLKGSQATIGKHNIYSEYLAQ